MASSGFYSENSTTKSSSNAVDKHVINCKSEDDFQNTDISKTRPPKPKSPKMLVRKNTPAELPTIAKIYGELFMKLHLFNFLFSFSINFKALLWSY